MATIVVNRILFVVDSLGTGGAEHSMLLVWKELASKGVDFQIVVLRDRSEGVKIATLDLGATVTQLSPGGVFRQARELADIIKRYKPKLVHSILWNSNLRTRVARLNCRFFHLESLVNTPYCPERLNDKRVSPFGLFGHRTLDWLTCGKLVDHFHVITKSVRDHYRETLGISEAKTSVVYRGRKSIEIKKRPAFKSDRPFRLITVGRQEFQKGQIYLLKAVGLLLRHGFDVHLDVLGREGAMSEELRQFVAANSLDDHIVFHGHVYNVDDYLVNADMFVFPSLYEGLGCALIEAEAAGLPIVANDIAVLKEVADEGMNALFVDVRRTDAFAEAIQNLAGDPERLKRFGEHSGRVFEQRFTESASIHGMVQLYESIASSSPH